MKKLKLIFVAIALIACYMLTAQVSINNDGTDPDVSAMLDVKSTEKGLLPPRMTQAEMYAIPNPAEGLIVFCADWPPNGCLMVYASLFWRCMYDGIGNNPPVASNVTFNGLYEIGSAQLTGSYTYLDAENDPEGTSLYQWYRADDASGTNQVAISGANALTYDWTVDDENKFIRFEVTPIASLGRTLGIAVMSDYQGPVATWNCGGDLVDNRDAQSYNTVQIGTQCWMAENLNVGDMIENTFGQTNNATLEKYCYNNDQNNCVEYGGLYQWNEIMQYVTTEGIQGICPTGWHVPTDAEWCTLEQFIDPSISCTETGLRGIDGGGKLKETGTSRWQSPNTGATNFYGFTAVGGGTISDGYYVYMNQYGYYGTSTSTPGIYYRAFGYTEQKIYRGFGVIEFIQSVRCLTDGTPPNQ